MARRVKTRRTYHYSAEHNDRLSAQEANKLIDDGIKRQKDYNTEPYGEELDELIDEIDELLETNAEEFVACYIQQGGE